MVSKMITDPKRLIIHRPGAQTAEAKFISWLLSLGLWWHLARVIRISLAAIGWGVAWGISTAIVGHTPAGTVLHAAMVIYTPEILALVLLLWGWALYNWLRFHGDRNKRRKPFPPLSLEEIGRTLSLPPSLVQRAKEAKIEMCHFDGKGNIQRIDCYGSVCEAENGAVWKKRTV